MTLVLVIDTATPAVTAAVVRADGPVTVLAERLTADPRAHAESLTPNVLGALSDSAVSMPDLGAVVPVDDAEALASAIDAALQSAGDPAPRQTRARDFVLDVAVDRYDEMISYVTSHARSPA